jgi:LuxR family maltose regulon positive regulatory protein
VTRTLLVSKLVPPPLPHEVVVRKRVDDRLGPALGARFTLVAAPAGAGKSVAVREWLEDSTDATAAWLSLDEDDDEPAGFWSYVLGALQRLDPELGAEALELLDESGAEEPQFLVALLNDLATSPLRPIVLVLDDLHWIHDPCVMQKLETFIERLPAGVRVVATTRADPPLPLARWRARGELLEVRDDFLRFRPDEVRDFLDRFEGLELDEPAVAMLTARTEGWAVGLQLAALSMQDRDDAVAYLRQFGGDNRIVADFLVGEVVDRQPPEITDFLLETSVLRRLTRRHCDAVTGRGDSDLRLQELESRSLFVTEVDPGRGVYRYHDLFGELLRHLLQMRRPDAVAGLHRRAAESYEADGELTDAVHHWVQAGDPARAFQLVTDTIVVSPGYSSATWEDRTEWLELIPTDFIAADPLRMIDCAYALTFMIRHAEAEGWIRRAEQHITDPLTVAWARLLAARGVWLGSLGDVEAGIADATEAREIFQTLQGPQPRDPYAARLMPMLARGYYMIARYDLALETLDELALRPDLPPLVTSLIAPAIEATAAMGLGELARADALSAGALKAAEQLAIPLNYAACEARLVQIGVKLERGRSAEAAAELEVLLDDVAVEHYLALQIMGRILEVRVIASSSGMDDAGAALAAVRRFANQHGRGNRFGVMLDRADARLYTATVDVERALDTLARLRPGTEREMLEARLEIKSGHAAAARGRLAGIEAESRGLAVELELLRARAEAPVREDVALAHVRRAVELGEPDGHLLVYIGGGPEITRLLRVLADREPSPFLEDLLAVGDEKYPVVSSAALVEPLTDRESSVLRLLAGTLTNREIAGELYMSLNTLKTHLKNLYRKLQVGSRHDAVATARRLGIL